VFEKSSSFQTRRFFTTLLFENLRFSLQVLTTANSKRSGPVKNRRFLQLLRFLMQPIKLVDF